MECKFQVGDKVVCVEEDLSNMTRNCVTGNPGFVTGGIYTITEIQCQDSWPMPAILLKEIHQRLLHVDGGRIMWSVRHFRPVKPMSFWLGEKQDIDMKEKV